MITCDSASLVYQDHGREVFACKEVTISLHPGEFLGILGPSGSGKSSLLYLLSGLKMPTSGSIAYHGKTYGSLSDEARAKIRLNDFGFVFQHPFLIGYLSATENVMLARPGKADISEAEQLLDLVGLGSKMNRQPHELSGGEKQRICVARALMGSPHVVFGDEPTAALDHSTGLKVMELLRAHRKTGSLVMVTHDESMLEGADRVARMVDGQIQSIESR